MLEPVTNPQLIHDALAQVHEPTVVVWNRLEGRPRTEDFGRSLQARVSDPLWLLTRQWQTGEYQAHDGGTPIQTRVKMSTSRIQRFAPRRGPARPFSEVPPLEAWVEREAIPLDDWTRAQMGRHWWKLLTASQVSESGKQLFVAGFPFVDPGQPSNENARLTSHQDGWEFRAALAGRAMDGGALYQKMRDEAWQAADHQIDGNSLSVDDRSKVAAAQEQFLQWFDRLYSQPTRTASASDSSTSDDQSWIPEQLEYRFACAAPHVGRGQDVLVADQYASGRLDWYSFDLDNRPNANWEDHPEETFEDEPPNHETLTFLPSSVAFGGMPSPRWWELEDRRLDFGSLGARTTELEKLLLAEFALIYSNDWFVIPYAVDVGSFCSVLGLAVVDTFGERTLIRPAGRGPDDNWQQWRMFNLKTLAKNDQADLRLFIPPVVHKLQESDPIEEVRFLRDEIANLSWAVETTIPTSRGTGRNGFEAAQDLRERFRQIGGNEPPPAAPELTDARVKYVAGTTVPENWIPLIPVHVPGSSREIQYRVAAMPRRLPSRPLESVTPRGAVLQPADRDPYLIHEEEVPRSGVVVARTYQRTRDSEGRTFVWLGRRKFVGRESRGSGLKFDQLEGVRRESTSSE